MKATERSATVDEIGRVQAELHDQALVTLGVTGDTEVGRFRDVLRRHGVGIYPLAALSVLGVVDLFFGYALTIYTPELSRALGLSVGGIAVVMAVSGIAGLVAPLPMAALSQRKISRALLCLVTAAAWSLCTLYTGLVTSLAGLMVVLLLNSLTSSSVAALHAPLLVDNYPPQARVRVYSAYQVVGTAGALAGPLVVALLAGPFDLTWRGAFLACGALSTIGTLFALGLRDPGYGKWDTQRLRQRVHRPDGGSADLAPEEVELGFWEVCRRLLLIPTIKRLLVGYVMLGVVAVPMATFTAFLLERKFDLAAAQRGLFTTYTGALSMLALLASARLGEKLYRQNPARLVQASGVLVGVGVSLIALGASMPAFWAFAALYGLAVALLAALSPAVVVAIMAITPAAMRPHLAGLGGVCVSAGAIGGALFLGGIERRFGIVGAMASLTVPGAIAALIIASAGRFIRADLDRMVDEVLEEEKVKEIAAGGRDLPLLACRGVDFSYGQVQVLFDVDLTVDDGELVALLGVNGAGKSTLLKVISGIGLPSKGSVRFRGRDITYLDAERRVGLGITQIAGGRAVFGPLTVEENLRSFGYPVSRDRRKLDAAIEECYAEFPQLAARRSQQAATLSGGEQQMLALSKALIMQPRLLVIDELSLGLAPLVVSQLLEMVRRINATGTAVILVEQSVNVALSVAEHAYFMEKGEMRFDGSSRELLARDDLLRAVFLQGAAARAGLQ